MKIVIGSDGVGYDLKEVIKSHLKEKNIDCIDAGTANLRNEVPYYEVAVKAAKCIQKGETEKCRTGN